MEAWKVAKSMCAQLFAWQRVTATHAVWRFMANPQAVFLIPNLQPLMPSFRFPKVRIGQEDQTDKLGERFGFHFFHELRASDFDGSHAEPQIDGDGFVRLAFNERFEDGMFARSEPLKPLSRLAALGQLRTMEGVPFQGFLDGFPKLLVAAWFFQEVERAGFQRPYDHRHVAVRRYDNMTMTGNCTSSQLNCSRSPRSLTPGIQTSSSRQPGFETSKVSRKCCADL